MCKMIKSYFSVRRNVATPPWDTPQRALWVRARARIVIEHVAECDVTRRRVDGEMSTAVDARASDAPSTTSRDDGVGSVTRARRVRCETRERARARRGDVVRSFIHLWDNLSMFSRRIVRGSTTTRTEGRAREGGGRGRGNVVSMSWMGVVGARAASTR